MSERHRKGGTRTSSGAVHAGDTDHSNPWTELVTPALPASVPVLKYADDGAGRTTVLCLPLIVGALVAGWYAIRGRTARKSAGADA